MDTKERRFAQTNLQGSAKGRRSASTQSGNRLFRLLTTVAVMGQKNELIRLPDIFTGKDHLMKCFTTQDEEMRSR